MVNLRIPGPTPIPKDVLQTSAAPMMNHRGPEFAQIIRRVTDGLNWVFGTNSDVLSLTTSGTGGLETAVVNTLSPGDKVLACSIGSFGDRLRSIAKTYGAEIESYAVEWGEAIDPAEVGRRLDADKDIKAVMVTHNETSTGVTNPLEAIAKEVRSRDRLIIVDAVSSMSSVPCPAERWGLDVVVSGSQKGWMVPPGLAFVWLSERAWAANAEAKMPRFYFDAAKTRDSLEKLQNPWTPAMTVYYSMDKAFELMRAEGLEGIFTRHEAAGNYTRERVKSLGLKLVPVDERYASNTVTAIWWPEGVDGKAISKKAREEHGVVLGGGQGKLEGKIFRIGHLGYFQHSDLVEALDVVEKLLAEARYPPRPLSQRGQPPRCHRRTAVPRIESSPGGERRGGCGSRAYGCRRPAPFERVQNAIVPLHERTQASGLGRSPFVLPWDGLQRLTIPARTLGGNFRRIARLWYVRLVYLRRTNAGGFPE
ncbi:MAG: alanine--glyoxylate aminotransferase family protein [Thermoflexaceae bacterium]|nr:alanine--glyoxylate aminotransferase family protein [Thermoflexaceae bacterium]